MSGPQQRLLGWSGLYMNRILNRMDSRAQITGQDFPGSPVIKPLCFSSRGHRFYPIYPPVYLPIYTSPYYLSVSPHQYIYSCIHLPTIHLPIYLSIHLPIYPSPNYLSIHLPIYPSQISPSIHLCIYPPDHPSLQQMWEK